MALRLEGRARRLGHNVNSDYLIASARKRETLDPGQLKRYLLETVDPGFAASLLPGDFLVAGRNFGCGSAMEVAVTVLLAAGIGAVLAESFARSFYRNAINNGLLPVQCDTTGINEGDRLALRSNDGGILVFDTSSGAELPGAPLPGIMLDILETGGLVPYLLRHGGFVLR